MLTLCITSGKGGVGKTTLSINLGLAMVAAGRRVLLLDGDLGLANLNVMLGIMPRFTIQDVVRGERTLSQIVTPTAYGLDLIAGGSGIAELADLDTQSRDHFLKGFDRLSGYDVLIVDTGAGIGENVIRFIMACDETLIVTTPHPTSLTDAYGVIKTVLSRESRALKLVVNTVNSENDARVVASRLIGVTDKFMKGSLTGIGYVPRDPLIERSILAQKPHLALNPTAASAQCIREIAKRLLGLPDDDPGHGFGRFLRRLMGR
jgi:flagellar biosynthesis protein FlhG